MEKGNCIIIHGCPSNKETAMNVEDRTFDKHWIPWVREQLLARGIKAETPLMPEPWEAVYENFKAKFETLEVNENTTLVGHSCGCAFIVRWLGETKQKIKKEIKGKDFTQSPEISKFVEKFGKVKTSIKTADELNESTLENFLEDESFLVFVNSIEEKRKSWPAELLKERETHLE